MTQHQDGLPDGVENTAGREKQLAHQRIHTAEVDAVRTNLVVDMLRAATARVAELHVENGYAPKLRSIFRS